MPSNFWFWFFNLLLNTIVGPEPAAEPPQEPERRPERELGQPATRQRRALDPRLRPPCWPAHASEDTAAIRGSIAAGAANSDPRATSCRKSRSGNR
jgi:hypothetical protein